MTMPDSGDQTGPVILIKLTEIQGDLKVITEQLKMLPDHEQRLRAIERDQAENAGSRDLAARWWAAAGVLLGGVSASAAWVAVAHR